MLVAGCVKFSAHWKATFQETQRHNIRYGGSREDGWADNDESIEKRRASHQSMNGSNRPTLQFLASNRTPLSTKHGCLVEYYIRGPWLKSYGTSVSWSKIVQLTPLENLLRQICIELCILCCHHQLLRLASTKSFLWCKVRHTVHHLKYGWIDAETICTNPSPQKHIQSLWSPEYWLQLTYKKCCGLADKNGKSPLAMQMTTLDLVRLTKIIVT